VEKTNNNNNRQRFKNRQYLQITIWGTSLTNEGRAENGDGGGGRAGPKYGRTRGKQLCLQLWLMQERDKR
jgi:hypothetical protein